MKKLIALCAVALSMGAFADSYLYWMIEDPVTWKAGDTAAAYDTARIGVLDSAGNQVVDASGNGVYLNLYSFGDSTSYGTSLGLDLDSGLGNSGFANLGSYAGAGYSYYIELLNDSTTFAGRSVDSLAYSSTAASILSDISQTSIPASAAWTSATYTTSAVPEPTSGMLLLFGLAGLALKRKRA